MSDQSQSSDTPLGLYVAPYSVRITHVEVIAATISVIWIVATGLFFMIFAFPSEGNATAQQWALVLLSMFLPVAMVWVVAASARSRQAIQIESLRLQEAALAIRRAAVSQAGSSADTAQFSSANSVQEKIDEIATASPRSEPAIAPFSTTRSATSTAQSEVAVAFRERSEPDQPGLPLEVNEAKAGPPLSTQDFIRALNFPETAEDKDGFAALRRALRSREAAQIVQASQDVLTLLSQDGIYMDDLPPDMARPELWRRFAAGERGRQIAALGGIHDRSSLALSAARMKQDTIFRDAAHHFLRLFDRMMSRFCEYASDAEISELSDTRTARAFMLLGRAAGTFD